MGIARAFKLINVSRTLQCCCKEGFLNKNRGRCSLRKVGAVGSFDSKDRRQEALSCFAKGPIMLMKSVHFCWGKNESSTALVCTSA